MREGTRNNYFIIVRIIIMVMFSLGGFLNTDRDRKVGVLALILLLVSLFMACICLKEFFTVSIQKIILIIPAIILALLFYIEGKSFIFLGVFLICEYLYLFNAKIIYFILPYIMLYANAEYDMFFAFAVISLIDLCYIQEIYVVSYYRNRTIEDVKLEQSLKRDMTIKEEAAKDELKKSMLMAENQILEERAHLSQTLHDKLGHNINGSIYQLEASKLIMEKDPEKARSMTQGVIDQLRTGMDEIRSILRKERPKKKELAIIQLYKLCDDCNNKGVVTELETEGNIDDIPDYLWEVILDNAFESVSNAMKYAQCKNIKININAMNKMVRCEIRDDGIGCESITDGMGLSGMRQRIRAIGGTIDFVSNAGFTVNMLMPIERG